MKVVAIFVCAFLLSGCGAKFKVSLDKGFAVSCTNLTKGSWQFAKWCGQAGNSLEPVMIGTPLGYSDERVYTETRVCDTSLCLPSDDRGRTSGRVEKRIITNVNVSN